MEIRFVAAATSAALILLAACGGSEQTSQDSTRTKNAALTTPSSPNDAGQESAQSKSCEQGGSCKVGDTGPQGGTVWSVETDKNVTTGYESPAKNIGFPDPIGPLCTVSPKSSWPNTMGTVPRGRTDMAALAAVCTGGAVSNIAASNPDNTGWYIPNKDDLLDMASMAVILKNPLPATGCYWSSTPAGIDPVTKVASAYALLSLPEQAPQLSKQVVTARCALRPVGSFTITGQQPPTSQATDTTNNTQTTATITELTGTTTAPANSLLPATCADGGICRVGDVGPRGGLIFYTGASEKPEERLYRESAPWNLGGSSSKPIGTVSSWCTSKDPDTVRKATSEGLQPFAGAVNTKRLSTLCASGIGPDVAAANSANGTDWYIPTGAELNMLGSIATYGPKELREKYLPTGVPCYWSSVWFGSDANLTRHAGFTFDSKGAPLTASINAILAVPCATHLVRSFTVNESAVKATMSTAPSTTVLPTTTTIQTTTTTAPRPTTTAPRATTTVLPKSCATGGTCKVGDIGPGGGIVFSVAPFPTFDGQYAEMSPTTLDPQFKSQWCNARPSRVFMRGGPNRLRTLNEDLAKPCTKGALKLALDYTSNGFNDWHLPTPGQAQAIWAARQFTKVEKQWLWTLTQDSGRSDWVYAVSMVDGRSERMNFVQKFGVRVVRSFGPRRSFDDVATSSSITSTTIKK